MDTQTLHKRKAYLDLLRVFSIFLVIFNHSDAFLYPLLNPASSPFIYYTLVVSICDKVAVPLFFMVSGALLLTKNESLSELLKRRVLRFAILIVLYQLLQRGYGYFVLGQSMGIRDFITLFLTGHCSPIHNFAVWFLYGYLAFLLMLPLLRLLVQKMSNAHFLYLFTIHLILWAFIPATDTRCTEYLPFSNQVFLYALAGYYAEHRVDLRAITSKIKLGLIAASVLCILLGALMCEAERILTHAVCLRQEILCFQGCVLIPVITIFLLVKSGMQKIQNPGLEHLLSVLGGAVFTIMLIENILRDTAALCVLRYMPLTYKSSVIISLLACIMGFPIGVLMKKIPFINKLV